MQEQHSKLVLGLTGLIGSGKSTVAALFAAHGAKIIDTDAISHQLTAANGAALEALKKRFGAACLNHEGALNRQLMREMVFAAPELRLTLEEILHPLILLQVKAELAEISTAEYTLLVVPLLFRSKNYLALTVRNIFVDCEYETLLSRLAVRSGLTPAQTNAILAQQVSREQQLELADDIIYNNGDLESLSRQVAELHTKYLLLR